MAIAPAQMGEMTLHDIEALAARFGAAVATIRQAQALLGPAGGAREDSEPTSRKTAGPPSPSPNWTAAELAERERLKRQFHAGLPEDIKAQEEQ